MFINIDEGMLKEKGRKLTDILREQNIHFPLYCGGNGQCGKCRVRVIEGELPITTWDREHFSEAELSAGCRIGCQAAVNNICTIEISEKLQETEFYIPSAGQQKANACLTDRCHYGLAVDIGSTTIAIVLVNLENGSICGEYTGLNHQRSFGADVMARIQASIEGHGAELQKLIRKDLAAGITKILNDAKTEENLIIDMIAIAGNTTMCHLLRGYDCHGLAAYPFKPVTLDFEYLDIECILGNVIDDSELTVSLKEGLQYTEIVMLPGISAFVGADITAGLWGCGILDAKKPRLFLDLGTNAEMAIGNGEKLIVSSAAAGPAFEGGQLSSGTGSIPGAIRDIRIQYGLVRYETIGRKSPVGICGTGIVSAMAELKKRHMMDEYGTLKGRFSSGVPVVPGKIMITQKDIREFQKAKAAIRAGLDVLLEQSDYNIEEIECLELAGGFGSQIDIGQAADIGLIPPELSHCVNSLGNGVIHGLIQYMKRRYTEGVSNVENLSIHQSAVMKVSNDRVDGEIRQMILNSKQIELAEYPGFDKIYVDSSWF